MDKLKYQIPYDDLTVVSCCLKSSWWYYWFNFVASLLFKSFISKTCGILVKNTQINESITFHSGEAWSKRPTGLESHLCTIALDWHVRKFVFAIQASFKKSNPTLRLLCMLYRLNNCCLKKIQSTNVGREARFGGISNNCICTLSSGANHFKRFLLRDAQAYYRLSFIIFTIFKVSLIIHTKYIQLISTNSKDVNYSCEGQWYHSERGGWYRCNIHRSTKCNTCLDVYAV